MIDLRNPVRPILVSTYPPEECGLATFTEDSANALDLAAGRSICSVMAIEKIRSVNKAARVAHVIDNDDESAYWKAANVINKGPWNIVSLQHEFGLYPGDWGDRVLDLVHNCSKPIVTTLHTLPTNPLQKPYQLIRELANYSESLIVMTDVAADLLYSVYGVPDDNVTVIPHGVPAVPFKRDRSHRETLGLSDRKVICTFGLINPGKGLEAMIRAMPQIAAEFPDVIYCIVGVTHPQVKRRTGEVYRQQLVELAESLGVSSNVKFVDQYLSLQELIAYLQSSDVFVTPYPGKDQIASGTMAYAMATVGAIVSTPYLYAQEVLADDRGLLVPFSSSPALAEATLRYLSDPQLAHQTRRRAYQYAKSMFWPNVGKQYLSAFSDVVHSSETSIPVPNDLSSNARGNVPVKAGRK